MKITLCGSIAFHPEMRDTQRALEALGHEVKLPPHEIQNEAGEMIPVTQYYAMRKSENTKDDSWI